MEYEVVDAQVSPEGRLEVLSRSEVSKLLDTSHGGLYALFRNCSLAVLNSGIGIDDGRELLERYESFEISIIQRQRGIKLEVKQDAQYGASNEVKGFKSLSGSAAPAASMPQGQSNPAPSAGKAAPPWAKK